MISFLRASVLLSGLTTLVLPTFPKDAEAQMAMCMTQVGSCPMMGGVPGSFCRCSGAPQFPGQVIYSGGRPQVQPNDSDDDDPPVIHKKKKPKPTDDDDND